MLFVLGQQSLIRNKTQTVVKTIEAKQAHG